MDTAGVIFIIGSGRSGTTLLYNLLATHSDVAWFSVLSHHKPVLGAFAVASENDVTFTAIAGQGIPLG